MNDKDLKKFHEEMRREATSSARMVGLVMLTSVMALVGIFLLASCSAPPPVSDYERNKIAWEEYMKKTNLRGTPHDVLQDMWTAGYIQAMIDVEVR